MAPQPASKKSLHKSLSLLRDIKSRFDQAIAREQWQATSVYAACTAALCAVGGVSPSTLEWNMGDALNHFYAMAGGIPLAMHAFISARDRTSRLLYQKGVEHEQALNELRNLPVNDAQQHALTHLAVIQAVLHDIYSAPTRESSISKGEQRITAIAAALPFFVSSMQANVFSVPTVAYFTAVTLLIAARIERTINEQVELGRRRLTSRALHLNDDIRGATHLPGVSA